MTNVIPKKREPGSTLSSPEEVASARWSSGIEALSRDFDFQLEWDNDLAYHVARNIQEMRAHRDYTQEQLAERAGVSQPKVALAESGNANLTVRMITRYISALNGRVRFTVEPAETHVPHFEPWWNLGSFLAARTQVTGDQYCLIHVSGGAMYGAWNHHLNNFPQVPVGAVPYSVKSAQLTPEATKLLAVPAHGSVDGA